MYLIRQPVADELGLILDLVAEAFPDNIAHRPDVRAGVGADPDYDPAHAFVAIGPDGHVAAVAFAKPTAIWLGGRRLPIGRLGTVCTSPSARRLGLGGRVVEAAAGLVDHLGAVMLDPAPEAYVHRFYEQLGFVPAVRLRGLVRCARGALLDRAPTTHLREAQPADAAALNRLYEQHYHHQSGTLERDRNWWLGRLTRRPLLWCVSVPRVRVAEAGGEVVAYQVATDDDDHRVWELAARPGAEAAALDLLADEAQRAGGPFTVYITADDRLYPMLTPLTPSDATPAPSPVMVRAADLALLRPFLHELVTAGGGRLTATADQVTITRAEARLACSWSQLVALCYNGQPLPDWLDAGHLHLTPDTPDTRQTLADLFPPRLASRRPTDAF